MRIPASVAALLLLGCPPTDKPPESAGDASSSSEAQMADLRGEQAAEAILEQWQRQHPDRDWVTEERRAHTIVDPADNSDLIGKGQGSTYGRITDQDVQTWERETMKMVAEGSRIFHSADLLGSTNGVSCDMCHPDGANTHPETYPKFQAQLGRVILLRDMINWCIQQPLRGEELPEDSAEMRALEAYIYAQRKGTELNYGKR